MFITFEGVEGAGKTTQIQLLAEHLQAQGHHNLLVTREPGAGLLGQELRRIVLEPPAGVEIDARAELLIMLADRAQHVAQMIRPQLKSGGIVLCDRYTDSSLAYQGYGRGLSLPEIGSLNQYATGGLAPQLTFLLDLEPSLGLIRQNNRTRMEAEALPFHCRVRAGFLALAAREPARFCTLDAALPPRAVAEGVWARVSALMA
jgi:dTMP kinase